MNGNKSKLQIYKFNFEITQALKKLSQLDNCQGCIAVAQDWIIILLAILIAKHFAYLYPISIIVIGSRQRALGTILHDSAHERIAKSKKLNRLLGTLFSGYWLFQSLLKYKETHVQKHHRYLGDLNKDPDFQYYIENGLYKPHLKVSEFLLQHIIAPVFLFKVPSYFLYLIKNRISCARSYPLEFCLMISFWISIALCAYYYNHLNLIISYWIIPFFTTHMIIGYLIEISEHYPFLGNSREAIYLSRNRHSHWFEGLFFSIHHENFHLVHHLMPSIPCWNMVKAHHIMMQDKKYREVNQKFGGIFISKNDQKPLMLELICDFWQTPSITKQLQ